MVKQYENFVTHSESKNVDLPHTSQGNGFAERNIRSIREVLRSVLLHRNLKQTQWRQLLPGLVFALNCSESKAIKCAPYNVVFGRSPTLPLDILFDHHGRNPLRDVNTATDYSEELNFALRDIFDHVIKNLELSKVRMQEQYNKNLRFNDYSKGDMVWLKVKHYKTGENRKLSPRRNGPWTVIEKLPNGVNFKICNDNTKETKIVHHDRINPVKVCESRYDIPISNERTPVVGGEESDNESSDNDAHTSSPEHSDYEPSDTDSSNDDNSNNDNSDVNSDDNSNGDISRHEDVSIERYPTRVRNQRLLPGTIPWDAIKLLGYETCLLRL